MRKEPFFIGGFAMWRMLMSIVGLVISAKRKAKEIASKHLEHHGEGRQVLAGPRRYMKGLNGPVLEFECGWSEVSTSLREIQFDVVVFQFP